MLKKHDIKARIVRQMRRSNVNTIAGFNASKWSAVNAIQAQ